MTRITVSRTITASPEQVFRTVSDIDNLPNTSPDIQRIDFLTEKTSGVGTRFRETRAHKGKTMVTELEVTEYVANRRVRMVADSHGTVWDTIFVVQPTGERVELTIDMHARAHKLMPRLLNPLLKGMFRKGMEKHIDQLVAYCERA